MGVSPETTPLDFAEFERLYPRLRRFAAAVGDRDLDPDDLVQDAVAAMLSAHRPVLDPEAYLRTTIVRLVSNRRRRFARWRARLPRLAEATETVDTYPSDHDLLDDLDPRDRAILHLTVVEGRPSDEVAATLGLSAAAVRQRAARARKALRSQLAATTPVSYTHLTLPTTSRV